VLTHLPTFFFLNIMAHYGTGEFYLHENISLILFMNLTEIRLNLSNILRGFKT